MPRSVTQWRPKASPEGPREAGIGQRWGCGGPLLGRLHSASGSHLPVEDTAPPCAVATRSAGRGTREAGSTRVGDATTALMDDRVVHSATGSHLPSEATAQPFAVATRSAGRGTREAGSTRVGDATTALMDDRVVHSATGSHLPSEATAQPFAVATRSAGRGTREAGSPA